MDTCEFCLQAPAALRRIDADGEAEYVCSRECPELVGADVFANNFTIMLSQVGKQTNVTDATILYPSDVAKSSWFLVIDGRHTTRAQLLAQISRENVRVGSLDSYSNRKGVLVASSTDGKQLYVRPGNEYQPHRWLKVPNKPSSTGASKPVAWRLPALGDAFKTSLRDKTMTGVKGIELPKGQFSVYAPQVLGDIREELSAVHKDLLAICAEMGGV